jgi:AbrB family looped-hinge helix DNA binding protein
VGYTCTVPWSSNTIARIGNTAMAHAVTSKGQVTIPKQVRDHLGIRAGSMVAFELTERGEVVLRPVAKNRRRVPPAKGRMAGLRGRSTVRMRTEEILALTRDAR